jgi:signal transduction histidine kinase
MTRRRRRRPHPRLSPEERALRAARRRANARVAFFRHAFVYAGVVLFLLVVSRRAALFVAFGWGIGLASHYFGAVVAPRLRGRLLEREVQRQVASDVPRERRTISDRHVRSLEDLSAQVAHEIRNPVTAAKSLVQQMGEDPASQSNVEYAKVALDELDRVERSVAHLLRYAREEDLQPADLRLGEVVESALAGLRERIDAGGVRVAVDVEREIELRADPEKLRRVLLNLLGNALDAIAEARPAAPRIELSAGENLAGTEVWLRVRDNGAGIEPDALAKIWSPFYTSKPSGTGLGLAISRKVAEAHGGSLEATSRPGVGSEFTLTIPKSAGPPTSAKSAGPPA